MTPKEYPAAVEAALIVAVRTVAPLMTDQPVNSVSIARNGPVLRVMTWAPDGSPITAQVRIGGGE